MRPDFSSIEYDPPTESASSGDRTPRTTPEQIDIEPVYGPDALEDLDHLDYAAGLAREYEGDLPPPDTALPETTADRILALAGGDAPSAADP